MGSLLLLFFIFVSTEVRATPLYSSDGAAGDKPDEYMVVLQNGARGLARGHMPGVRVQRTFKIGNWEAMLVTAENNRLGTLRGDPNVKYMEPNTHRVHIAGEMDSVYLDPNKRSEYTDALGEDVSDQVCNIQQTGYNVWGLTRTSSRGLPNFASNGYHYSETGSNTDIYVVDTGVYLEHNEFEGRAWHGFTSEDIRYDGDGDGNGHGTHVAATAAGQTYGVAKNATIIAVKVLDDFGQGSLVGLIEGLEWAVSHHQTKKAGRKSVINMSLTLNKGSSTLDDALAAAVDAGVPVVVAAANFAKDACEVSPARSGRTITVGATNIGDNLAYFSNYGKCVDINAPGSAILSAYIRVPDNTVVMSGTSQASPHVAGAVARYLSTFDGSTDPTPAEIKTWLVENSTKGVLNIEEPKMDTPNRLLFQTCT